MLNETTLGNHQDLQKRRIFKGTPDRSFRPKMSQDFLEIDGSAMEGGGQILRMSVGLSALLRRPIRIAKIRGGRAKPGLQAQHLNGIQLVAGISEDSSLSGAAKDSLQIDFAPGKTLRGGRYEADTRTAGSTCLLAQASLPCLLFADRQSRLDLRGGTDAKMAPPVGYYVSVFRRNLNKFGADFDFEVARKGYFPRGGGQLILTVPPVRSLTPVTMTEMGDLIKVTVTASVAGSLPVSVAREMAGAAKEALKRSGVIHCDIAVEAYKEERATGSGSSVWIVCETSTGCVLGGSEVGSNKERPRLTGEAAARALLDSLEARPCVDEHMQDQVVVLMALAAGRSRVRAGPLTLHTETAVHIARAISGAEFRIEKAGDGSGAVIIECDGIGLENGSAASGDA